LERVTLPVDVMHEICRQLAPYQAEEKPITGQTVIYNDLSIDSLAVMDIIMELEEIRTKISPASGPELLKLAEKWGTKAISPTTRQCRSGSRAADAAPAVLPVRVSGSDRQQADRVQAARGDRQRRGETVLRLPRAQKRE